MNKKLNKIKFNQSSQISTKYYENLKQTPSKETATPSPIVGAIQSYSATDSVIPDDSDTLTEEPKKWEMPSWLTVNLAVWPIIATVLFYFWNLSAIVNETKFKTIDINVKISSLESKMDNTSKELVMGQNSLAIILERIVGKIDRFVDGATTSKKIK